MPIVVATCLAALLLAAGCAGDAERYDRPLLSAELGVRTGHSVGPGVEPGTVAIPEGVCVEDGVSEEEAVAIALWNNAPLQEAVAGLGFDRADLMQAGLLTNPAFYVLFPLGPKQLEFTLKWPLEALWLRPKRLAAAELDCEKAASLLVEHGLDLVRDVKVAVAALRLARGQLALARESASLLDEIASLEDARLRSGYASEMEVGAARVKALKARSRVAALSFEPERAEERLRALLGLGQDRTPIHFEDSSSSVETAASVPGLDDLLRDALAARPDLRAAELALEAAGERAGLARWESYKVTLLVDANAEGKKGFEIGPGLDVEIPLFDQGQARRLKADAGLEKAVRHYVTVRDAITLGVREGHARLRAAREALARWRSEILPAQETALLAAERSLQDGEMSYLQVLQSRELLLEVRSQQADLDKELAVARAELERQAGYRLMLEGPSAAPVARRSDGGRVRLGSEE